MHRALFALPFVFLAGAAAAQDLYRWRDPETGSIRYSNIAPDWYEPGRSARGRPRVEVIPSAARPGEKPGAGVVAAGGAPEMLEARRRELLELLRAQPVPATREDFLRAGSSLQPQLEAYQAVRAELDRADPAGAGRRRTEESAQLGRLREALEKLFPAGSPVAVPR